MKFVIRRHLDSIAIVEAKGALTQTSSFVELRLHCLKLAEQGCRAVLIDLKACRRANFSGIAALVALVGEDFRLHIAFCGLSKKMTRKLQSVGLDRGLQIYATVEDALRSPSVRNVGLCHTRAVILCNENESKVSPLLEAVATPMLDVLGQPLIARNLAHMASHGIADVIANPGENGHQIIAFTQAQEKPANPLRFSNEGFWRQGQWKSEALGSASSLRQIQSQQNAFSDDFLVLNGNTLTDVDLAALTTHHRECGADMTVAISDEAGAAQWKASLQQFKAGKSAVDRSNKLFHLTNFLSRDTVGAYVFSPSVLDLIPDDKDWDILQDLLPALMAQNRAVEFYRSDFFNHVVRSPNSYAQLLLHGLKMGIPSLQHHPMPGGMAEGAAIRMYSQTLNKEASAYVAPCAEVDSNVELLGHCFVGAGVRISGPSVLENCIVLEGANIAPGFWGQNMILHADWAMDYRLAGSTHKTTAMAIKKPTEPAVVRQSA